MYYLTLTESGRKKFISVRLWSVWSQSVTTKLPCTGEVKQMWSRHTTGINLVALFTVGLNYLDCNMDMKVLTRRLVLSNMLKLEAPARLQVYFYVKLVIHRSSSVKSIILP